MESIGCKEFLHRSTNLVGEAGLEPATSCLHQRARTIFLEISVFPAQHIDFILSLNAGQSLSPKMEDNDCPRLGEN